MIYAVLKREHNGYVFNNMLMAVLDSALTLAEKDAATIEDIDKSWMGVLHTTVGPFGIMDSIGLDTAHEITDYWAKINGDKQASNNAALYLIQKQWYEWSHEVFFAAASWTNLHRPSRGPFMLVQRSHYYPSIFPYQHKRAGAAIEIRCGGKKDLVTEWLPASVFGCRGI